MWVYPPRFSMKIDVLMTRNESDLIAKYASLSPADILEIGTYQGGTTKVLCESAPKNRAIWTLDRYMDTGHVLHPGEISREIDCPNLFLIVGWSENLGELWHRPIGLLLLDSEHEFGTPMREFNDFAPFVIPEGFVALHDAAGDGIKFRLEEGRDIWAMPEPKALMEYIKTLEKWEYVEEVDTLVIFKKKRSNIKLWHS